MSDYSDISETHTSSAHKNFLPFSEGLRNCVGQVSDLYTCCCVSMPNDDNRMGKTSDYSYLGLST